MAVLRQLDILDTPAEERFDRLTRVARSAFGVAEAAISFVDERREWVKSSAGFRHPQLARNVSLAAHAVGSGDVVAVPDVAADVRFYDNPIVLEPPRIRFFAAHPLQSRDGAVVGAITIYDHSPREFGATDRELLSDLAAICERELREGAPGAQALAGATAEVERIDPVTRLWNRTAMFDIMSREIDCARADGRAVALVLITVDLDEVLRRGTAAGDAILAEVAHVLRASLRPYDIPARFGGNEFAALLNGVEEAKAADAGERIRRTIESGLRHPAARHARIAVGVATASGSAAELERLVRSAQSAVWLAKREERAATEVAFSSPGS